MIFVILVSLLIFSSSLTEFFVLNPLNLFHILDLPGFMIWGGVFVLFAWIFGENHAPH